MISVILIEPQWASNVGAAARVIANFDFKELVLINPKCSIDELDAVKRAKHALPLLKKAIIRGFEYLDDFDYLIATTSKLSTDYNILRTPISPEQFAKKLSLLDCKNKKIGIVFGREGDGLHNNEIKKCDFVVSIPSSTKYPAMNISHAISIVLYEIHKQSGIHKVGDNFRPIGEKEKEHLLKSINGIINGLKFSTKEKKETQEILWKRIIGKSFLSRRESFALFGFFKKIKEKL